jgi:hypothetical protein
MLITEGLRVVPAVPRGMEVFKQGEVEESIILFDQALEADPSIRPYLWQRGLSLYYGEWIEGREMTPRLLELKAVLYGDAVKGLSQWT